MNAPVRARLPLVMSVAVVALLAGVAAPQLRLTARSAADLPARLTDAQFWQLTEQISEQNGEFQSDNFLSNERGYQAVIPELIATAKPGRVYLGVGPEQNFPYIIALKPALAIIFDIRRGNLHEHLLYKALFEMSSDRADFLSRLFSRKRPEGLTADTSVAAVARAYDMVPPSEELYQANFKAVSDSLTVRHGFKLHEDDLPGIDYVYKTAFFTGGPSLTYNMAGRGARGGGRGGGNSGTYADIQAIDDGNGVNRGFLANEANFRAMKDFETRNLLVPVVGDFGGTQAIRAVGKYLKEQNVVVSAFYLRTSSDLNRSGTEDVSVQRGVAAADESSTFIFTRGRGSGRLRRWGGWRRWRRARGGGGLNTTFLRPMADASHDGRTLTMPDAPASQRAQLRLMRGAR